MPSQAQPGMTSQAQPGTTSQAQPGTISQNMSALALYDDSTHSSAEKQAPPLIGQMRQSLESECRSRLADADEMRAAPDHSAGYEHRDDVDCHDDKPVELNWHRIYVIRRGIE